MLTPTNFEGNELLELAAIVYGLTELSKIYIPVRYRAKLCPLISVIIGGATSVYLHGYSPDNVLYGFGLGLAATGLYRMVKTNVSPISVRVHDSPKRYDDSGVDSVV